PDVAKLKKRALEYEQKKQFDKALDTYTLVLAELDEHVDEADVALYNRVGDLLLRRGDVSEAVDHYEKAVDLYTDGGFFNNAIALCNKILRNAPGRNSVYYKLGKISARKGFVNDAKQNFLEYADRMQKSGQLEEAFRALKEFADLCPDQDDIRLMLADQLVRKDRKSEAIEQLHALYDKFSAEGRSAEARATVDRMKALDPALEPKETVRVPASKGDLVFLDVNYDEPSRPITSAPSTNVPMSGATKAATAWTVIHPTTPSATPAVAIEMPAIDPDVDIDINLDAPTSSAVAELPGLSHGALLPDGTPTAGEGIVSHVDLGLITGFQNSAVAGDQSHADIAPLAELEAHSHLDAPDENDASAIGTGTASVLDDLELEDMPSLDLPSLELDDDTDSVGELPMLDTSMDDASDEGSLGGSLTFISVDSPAASPRADAMPEPVVLPEPSPEPIMEPEPEPEPVAELPPEPEYEPEYDVSPPTPPPAAPPRVSAPFVHAPDIGDFESVDDLDLELERSPTLEMDAIVPDGGPPLPLLEMDEIHTPFDRENALSGLPMLDPDQLSPMPADDEEDDAVELVWQTEPADEPQPIVPLPPRVSSPTPIPPPLSRVDQLRIDIGHLPQNWDLHRQLAEALLERGDRAGGITELEATMFGYEREGNLPDASRTADELIRVEPNSVRYHQKRVEYAVRANDKPQLVDAYLALAESLFRSGQLDKSRAVYGRVLELSPADARAASALRELGADVEIAPPEPIAPAPVAAPEPKPEPAIAKRVTLASSVSTPVPAPIVIEPEPEPEPEPIPLALEVERTSSTLAIDEELFAALETALPEPPRPANRTPVAPPARPPIAASSDDNFVNLSEWLRDEEPPKNTRMVAAGEEEPQEQQDFADMLTKFKQGVTSNVDDTDHESHYDLGVAYKEMGLLDEAISEFQKALRGTEQRVRTYEALGQCFVEKRQYQIAMTILLRALNDADASDDTLVGVLYLLGYASESLQKWEDAVGYYERVFTVDIQFRDVGERLSAVERKAK
ncbi:MAG: tetratricopeptide repeat protein, partial [Gemmatimonadaceae bacterium]